MEMEFLKSTHAYMKKVLSQVCSNEQTQDIRLGEEMPEIGRIIACWGQPMIRSKEWRNGSVGASGGVVAWVLYESGNTAEVKSVQTWIPFQWKWDLKDSSVDGQFELVPLLKSIDARVASAGKILVRATVNMQVNAYQADKMETFLPADTPNDVQTLIHDYPCAIAVEAGEKVFSSEEELMLPQDLDPSEKMLYCRWNGKVSEKKIMTDKLVFHGYSDIHMLYKTLDGKVKSFDAQLPFSQYAQLDKDYGPDASAQIQLILTGMETDIADGKCMQRLTMAAQYLISDREMISVCEDAYSTKRNAALEILQLQLPVLLDQRNDTVTHCLAFQQNIVDPVDICWMPDHTTERFLDGSVSLEQCGTLQLLYYDEEGKLYSAISNDDAALQIASADKNSFSSCYELSACNINRHGDPLQIEVKGSLSTDVHTISAIPVVTGIKLEEKRQESTARPSLILKRYHDLTLWELAKECGTTVDAIMRANGLSQEPEESRMLLIPML